MSTGTNGPLGDTDSATAPDREEVMTLLEDGIREAHRKVESGRVRNAENEKVRQGWIRVLAYSANQYRQLKKDQELEDMKYELEALKSEISGDDDPAQ
jgi:hypothetical protein